MRVITRKRLHEFADRHPDARPSLEHWFRLMKAGKFQDFSEPRGTFPHADLVGPLVVFNIGGIKARLIAAVHFNRGKIYIRGILTHGEYDKGGWKK